MARADMNGCMRGKKDWPPRLASDSTKQGFIFIHVLSRSSHGMIALHLRESSAGARILHSHPSDFTWSSGSEGGEHRAKSAAGSEEDLIRSPRLFVAGNQPRGVEGASAVGGFDGTRRRRRTAGRARLHPANPGGTKEKGGLKSESDSMPISPSTRHFL